MILALRTTALVLTSIAATTGMLSLGWAYQVKIETLAIRHSGDMLDSSSNALKSLQLGSRVDLVALANASSFVDRDSGCFACTPDGTPVLVKAFEDVASDPGALLAFQELTLSAAPAGRIYGLCGLYYADSAALPTAQNRLQSSGTPVWLSLSYDVFSQSNVAALARKPEVTCQALAPSEEVRYLLYLWQGRTWRSGRSQDDPAAE